MPAAPRKQSPLLLGLVLLLFSGMGCNRLFTRREPQDKGGLLLVIAVKAAGDQLEQYKP
ncbi:MAG TPA: hypothetical protein VF543_14295 [Pyrinomonadaceae bacterium]